MVQMVDGFLRFMSSSAQLDFRSWPDCSAIFSRAYSILKRRLGEESEFTRQAYVLWKGTDLGSVSIAEYRQQLRDVFDASGASWRSAVPGWGTCWMTWNFSLKR